MRVIAYVPDVPRSERYRREIRETCAEKQHLLVDTVDDPAEARRRRDAGEADRIIVARHAHAPDVYPELLVVEIPRQRPGRHAAVGGVLAGMLGWVAGHARQKPALAATAAAATAVAAVGAVALPALMSPGPDRNGEDGLAQPPPATAPAVPPGTGEPSPEPTPSGPTPEPTGAPTEPTAIATPGEPEPDGDGAPPGDGDGSGTPSGDDGAGDGDDTEPPDDGGAGTEPPDEETDDDQPPADEEPESQPTCGGIGLDVDLIPVADLDLCLLG